MSDKQQQQNKSTQKTQKQKPKPPKPLAPVEMPVENVWEAPVPAPEVLRQALGEGGRMTPDMLRSLQRTMGNSFTEQYAKDKTGQPQGEVTNSGNGSDGNVSQALARVQALRSASLSHSTTSGKQSQSERAEKPRQEPLETGVEELSEFEAEFASGGLQREEKLAQRAQVDELAGEEIGGDVEGDIERQRGSGQSLPDDTRSHMEGTLGSDLGNVRVHTDTKANELSESLNAKAFTTGSDIFFGSGEYDPASQSGQKLLAHELTHVVQQGESAPIEEEPAAERQVDRMTGGQNDGVTDDGEVSRSVEDEVVEEDGGQKEELIDGLNDGMTDGQNDGVADTVQGAESANDQLSSSEIQSSDQILNRHPSSGHSDAPSPRNNVIQKKMRVSHPDDKYEKEAEAVAEAAIRPPTPTGPEVANPEKVGPQKSLERTNSNADIGRGGGDSGGNNGNNNKGGKGNSGAKKIGDGAHRNGAHKNGAHKSGASRKSKPSASEFGSQLRRVTKKSRMTAPDDRYEREAEQMETEMGETSGPQGVQRQAKSFTPSPKQIARKVRTPDANVFRQQISKSLEKTLNSGEKPNPASAGKTIQRAVDDAVALAHEQSKDPHQDSKNLDRQIARQAGQGRSLPAQTRKRMEQRFDADFSGVRVHTDEQASTLSRSIDARAFTTGSDIFFDEGEFQPGSTAGDKLLVHELTHVMQQGAAPQMTDDRTSDAPHLPTSPSPHPPAQRKMRVSHPDDKYEKEADEVANQAVSRQIDPTSRSTEQPDSNRLSSLASGFNPRDRDAQRDSIQRSPADIQRDDDDKPTMVAPGGEVKEDPPQSTGGDNTPAQDNINKKSPKKEAAGAADGASKDAQGKTKDSGSQAKSAAESNAANARGNKGKTGKGANSQKMEEQTLPGDATVNMQQLPPTLQDPSVTNAKRDNFAAEAEKMPPVQTENLLPTWKDLTQGTIQLKEDEKSDEEKKAEAVDGAKQKQGGKKKPSDPKKIKPKKKNEKAKKGAEKGAKAAAAAGAKAKDEGGGEKVVAQVEMPDKAPSPPPLPDLPKPSELGGVTNLGTPPQVDTENMGGEIAWMRSPRMQKISNLVNKGTLDKKIEQSSKKREKRAEEAKAQRTVDPAAAKPIQRTPSGLSTFNDPKGFKRSDSGSGLLVPDRPEVDTQTDQKPQIIMPSGLGQLSSGLSRQSQARAERGNAIQRSPVALNGLSGDISVGALSGNIGGPQIQRFADDSGGAGMFDFLDGEMAEMFTSGGGAQSLMNDGLDMSVGSAMAGFGGGGFAEGMLSSTGAMDVLDSVGMNVGGYGADLPLPNPDFVMGAMEQYNPVNWFDQTIGGLGDSAAAVAGGFASVGSEGTVWGKIAATMEAVGSIIDLISQILDIVSLILTIIDILCTVMIALAPLTIVIGLVPIFPFIWTPGVFSPIKTGVATVSRILDKIADVLGIVGDVLLAGASIFRILDMLETLADPKPSEERQGALDMAMNLFAEETMAVFSNTMADHVGMAFAARDNIMSGQLGVMEGRKIGSVFGDPPPDPPDGLPFMPPEATPDAFSDFGEVSGDLAAQEMALMMQQEEIGNLMDMGQSAMEEIEATRDTNKANRKGVDSHKKDMDKKKSKQKSMKQSSSKSKGKMGKGKSKGGAGKALMSMVMPMLMPLIQFGMSWGAGGNADSDGATSGAGQQATQMANFFSANNIADALSAQRIIQTTQLMAQATGTDDMLGNLDGFLGEKFDLGMSTIGMLTQDAGLIGDQLGLIQEDRQAIMMAQEQSAVAASSWMDESRMAREQMFFKLEMGLGMIEANETA
ncbi:MAG: DUF4157 domain-containing protein [Chloroflexota bacterium]